MPWLISDPIQFRRAFDRQPFVLRHRLAHHPLLGLARLAELADDLSTADTIREIETNDSHVVLTHIERHPAYRELLGECVNEIGKWTEPVRPGMTATTGVIVVSSPNVVTPFRMDATHTILIQARGAKTITIFNGRDRTIVADKDLEAFYAGGERRDIRFKDAWKPKGVPYTLWSGDALHIPVTFPHHVCVGAGYSVSLAITFETRDLERRAAIQRLNHRIRSLGVRPLPAGTSAWRDTLKVRAAQTMGRLRQTR